MAIVWRKLQSLSFKKTLAVVVLAGLSAVMASSIPAAAQGPQFNIFPISCTGGQNRDFPLLDARNVTRGENNWCGPNLDHHVTPVQANPNDEIEFLVYFHNGAIDATENTAHNTIIQAFANPSLGTAALNHTVSASIRADNAAQVFSGNKGGDMQINIQGGVPQSLSLVPGSVRFLKDQGLPNPGGAQQAPDTIFSSGVNVGDVRGCFEFHGFVVFRVKVSNVQQGDLAVQKNVRNVSAGQANFSPDQVNANPGQTVEYQILVTAQNNQVQNVSMRDSLDSRLTLTGQVNLVGEGPLNSSNFFSSSGVSIGNLNASQTKEIRFQAVVAAENQFTVGTHSLPNTAFAFTSQRSAQDSANVIVTKQAPPQITCVFTWDPPTTSDGRGIRKFGELMNVHERVTGLTPGLPVNTYHIVFRHVSGEPTFRSVLIPDAQGNFEVKNQTVVHQNTFSKTGDYNAFIEKDGVSIVTCRGFTIQQPDVLQIDLEKAVRNDQVGGDFNNQGVNNVEPGRRVTFRLTISPQNSNTNLTNVALRDTLPASGKLIFVSNSLNVNGQNRADSQFVSSGIPIDNIAPGQTVTVTFQADVASASQFTAGQCEVLTNSATVTASGNLSDTDTATVQVCKAAPTKQPGSPGQRPQ